MRLNDELIGDVKEKLEKAQSIIESKSEPACDEECKKGCDAKADGMIREM